MDMTKTLKLQNCRLRKMNNELIKKVQHWKMVAADKDKEKFGLMQEINRLMLQLNMLRKRGDSCAQQLESAIMLSGQSVLSHLVESSTAVVNIIEVMKGYMEDRRKIDSSQLQWTNDSRSSDEVHQALPTSMDERSIQPVVSLPYWGLSEDSGGQKTQPLQNSGGEKRTLRQPIPMSVLRELFNPLPNNSYNLDDSHSTDDLDLSDESKSYEKENNSTVSENQETYLSVVEEEDEETQCSSRRGRDENPSEGLLDASPSRSNDNIGRSPHAYTPTSPEPLSSPVPTFIKKKDPAQPGPSGLHGFTVSSRDSQATHPLPTAHHSSGDTVCNSDSEVPERRSSRLRKNVVYKEKPLNVDPAQPGPSGLHGFTVSSRDSQATHPLPTAHHSSGDTVCNSDSEVPERRSSRLRKNVVYKEKPLNVKMRR